MAIFSRRTLQRLINENAAFLRRTQLEAHVKQLNAGGLSAEWEVVLLNVFNKLGKVIHEQRFKTKKPDLYFEPGNSNLEFLADIKSIWDEGFDRKNPVRLLIDRLHDEVLKHGVQGAWRYDVGGDFERAHRTGTMVELKLPALVRFDIDIFNNNWEEFISRVQAQPDVRHTYTVNTDAVELKISYVPSKRWTASGSYPSYKSITASTHLIQNCLWNGLVSKAGQLRATGYEGVLGIMICDIGTDFLKQGKRIIQEFFRSHRGIHFVLTVEVIQNFGHGSFNETLIHFYDVGMLPSPLKALLTTLTAETENLFPYPERNAINALNSIASTKKHIGVSHHGGMTMRGTEVRVSSRAVLDLLAGKITYEDFPDSYKEFFADMAREGRLFTSAFVEKDSHEHDDDWLNFTFGEPDPAVRPFTAPPSSSQ